MMMVVMVVGVVEMRMVCCLLSGNGRMRFRNCFDREGLVRRLRNDDGGDGGGEEGRGA